MPWDTNTSVATGNIVFTTFTCDTGSATTAMATSYVNIGFLGHSGGFYDTGITSCGSSGNGWSGQSGQSRCGFASDQIRLVRNDFDSVKRDRKRKRAELKARRLFKRVVGDVRYQRFREIGYHEILGKSGTRYRLAPGQWVKVMEEDKKSSEKIKHLLCAHLAFGVPWFDTMVVQHLMLTASKETEERFLGLANVHEVSGPYPVPELEVAA